MAEMLPPLDMTTENGTAARLVVSLIATGEIVAMSRKPGIWGGRSPAPGLQQTSRER